MLQHDAAQPPALNPADLADDADDKCVHIDRILLQLVDSLDKALVAAAPYTANDRRLKVQLLTARMCASTLRREFGGLGLDLEALFEMVDGRAAQ